MALYPTQREQEERARQAELEKQRLEKTHVAFIEETISNDCPTTKLAEFLWKKHLELSERITREEERIPLSEMRF